MEVLRLNQLAEALREAGIRQAFGARGRCEHTIGKETHESVSS